MWKAVAKGNTQHQSCNNVSFSFIRSFDERVQKSFFFARSFFCPGCCVGFRRFCGFLYPFQFNAGRKRTSEQERERCEKYNLIFKFDGNLYVISMLPTHFQMAAAAATHCDGLS